ncbi:MAG: hypothetical protein WC429_24065 [Verrucomicrobiia bacterium]|jgi:hypothetical protein
MHVALAFNKLIAGLQPKQFSIVKAKAHALSIKSRLQTSFNLKSHFFIGSTARETAIHGYSDVDLLSVFPRDTLKWGDGWISSDTFIRNVRNDLDERFHATEVRRDEQAVVVSFGAGSEPVDVVPAVFHEFKTAYKVPVFLIPDGNGGWMETAPAAHNNYVKVRIEQSGGKLAKTIQLIKHWRNCRISPIPLASIHLELLVASSGICVGPKSYARCLYDAFHLLHTRECRGLRDPTGLAGVLYAVDTDAQAEYLVGAVDHALDHARRAVIAQTTKDWREAIRQWNIVFNGQFH